MNPDVMNPPATPLTAREIADHTAQGLGIVKPVTGPLVQTISPAARLMLALGARRNYLGAPVPVFGGLDTVTVARRREAAKRAKTARKRNR